MKRSLVVLLLLGGGAFPVHAQTLITLDNFNATTGTFPFSGLTADAAGNLFGTTLYGGTSGLGTVFEIVRTGSTYGSPITLGSFNNTNGAYPEASLTADAAGNLFGTTYAGGTANAGTVFEIARTGSTYGSPTTLASFNNTNGSYPSATLITDAAGNLFGTTTNGGAANVGTVFEIARTGSTYGSPTTLATFNTTNGSYADAGLTMDAAGNLFGTTYAGGTANVGTVFEIARTGSTYGSFTTLATFNTTNGADPRASLIADAAGNLFGTTVNGGAFGYGTVFEIAKTGSTYGSPTTLATFNTTNGANPRAGLIADASGNLFGTTENGGAFGYGTVFEITKTGGLYGSPTTLVTFNTTNGANPYSGLIADAAGNLFGTTTSGGTSGGGTVFEISNSGFVAAQQNTQVPEPASLVLLSAGIIGLATLRQRSGGRKLIGG